MSGRYDHDVQTQQGRWKVLHLTFLSNPGCRYSFVWCLKGAFINTIWANWQSCFNIFFGIRKLEEKENTVSKIFYNSSQSLGYCKMSHWASVCRCDNDRKWDEMCLISQCVSLWASFILSVIQPPVIQFIQTGCTGWGWALLCDCTIHGCSLCDVIYLILVRSLKSLWEGPILEMLDS